MIHFDRLRDVVKATEALPLGGFRMDEVNCETAGCMIGNYNAFSGRNPDRFHFKDAYTTPINDWEYFGISTEEYTWLFAGGGIYRLKTQWESSDSCLRKVTRAQALSRLRKFIAYKRRKHAMLHDEKYGVSDAARRAEGNQLFAVLAVQDVLAEPSVAAAV